MGKGARSDKVKNNKNRSRKKGGFEDWKLTPKIVAKYGGFFAEAKSKHAAYVAKLKKERYIFEYLNI